MGKYIPTNVVRKIIADVLVERGNGILEYADELAEEEIKVHGATSDYHGEVETTSAGTYVLADDVLSGEISLKEAIESVLSKDEVDLVKSRCEEWLNKQKDFYR